MAHPQRGQCLSGRTLAFLPGWMPKKMQTFLHQGHLGCIYKEHPQDTPTHVTWEQEDVQGQQ